MSDKIARHRGDADRRQTGRRISPDHKLKGIEGAGERRSKRARDRGRGAAADHETSIGTAQMKGAAQRGAETAGKLAVSSLESDRSADARGPDCLHRHDHTPASR